MFSVLIRGACDPEHEPPLEMPETCYIDTLLMMTTFSKSSVAFLADMIAPQQRYLLK